MPRRTPRPAAPLIADRAEFVDALAGLRRGQVLVRGDDEEDQRCLVGGQLLHHCWRPLKDYGLLDELPRSLRDGRIHCYRLNARGRAFAERACAAWRARPLWQRLAMRLTG